MKKYFIARFKEPCLFGFAKNVKLVILLLLFLLLSLYPIPYVSIKDGKASLAYTLNPTSAADSTPSADIKAKLEELKKEIASKAAKLKQEVNKKLQDKAYIGKVKTKTATSLTLGTGTGPKIVTLNQDTVYESQVKTKQKSASWRTLAEEDYVAALGDIDETQVLTAKKIILLPASTPGGPTPTAQPKAYLWGKIISISDQLVTLKDREHKNVAVILPSTVKLNDFVILTGVKNKNDIFEAEFVYVIPQGGILKPKKIATPSAQIKPATPSGKKR